MIGSPPHTRGIFFAASSYDVIDKVHPRIRGEYGSIVRDFSADPGSPPHTRGIFVNMQYDIAETRFTPAYAGNILFFFCRHTDLQVHPRIRGEYFRQKWEQQSQPGSPPHTRGIYIISS